MNEMYWITRLDGVIIAIIVPMVILLIVAILNALFSWDSFYESDERKTARKRATICGIIGLLLLIVQVFIPTTNQALIIYGVGGTIDYVKSNDKAKQLPDKVIIALDKYLESINEEDK